MQSKQKKSKKEQDPNAPQDQDIIDAIKESSEKNLKPTFVYLNKLNNEMINNKEEIFHSEYLALKSKYKKILRFVPENKRHRIRSHFIRN